MLYDVARVSLISAFASNGHNPLRSFLVKLAVSLTVFLSSGICICLLISHYSLPQDLPFLLIISVTIVSSWLLSLIVHFLLSLSVLDQSKSSTPAVLNSLPLGKHEQFFIYVLPQAIVQVLLLSFIIPVLVGVAQAMDTNIFLVLTVAIIGSVGAMGSAQVISKLRPYFSIATVGLSITLLCLLLIKSVHLSDLSISKPLLVLATTLCVLSLSSFVFLFKSSYYIKKSKPQYLITYPQRYISSTWYLIKLQRNHRTSISMLFAFIVTSSIAFVVWMKNAPTAQSAGLLIVSAIVTAAFASDSRGIVRRYKAIEINSARAISSFISSEFKGLIVGATIIGAPLVVVIIMNHSADFYIVFYYFIALHIGAAVIGLFSSSAFVPQQGEIGMQFFAATMAVGLLVGIQKRIGTDYSSLIQQGSAWIVISSILLLIIMFVEHRRINNYGNFRTQSDN